MQLNKFGEKLSKYISNIEMIRAGQGHIHTISVDKKKISYENKIKNHAPSRLCCTSCTVVD